MDKSRKGADSGEEEDWEAGVQRAQYGSEMGLQAEEGENKKLREAEEKFMTSQTGQQRRK